MKKDKICSDGFPEENELDGGSYSCDNCGKECNFNANRIDGIGEGEQAELHLYGFCDKNCAEEFARDNGLILTEPTEEDKDNGVYSDLTFKLNKTDDPVAAAVKSIDLGEPTESEQTDAATEQPTTDIHERKAAECLKEVVKQAMEINDLASKIAGEKEYLKGLQKEYEALVKRQNDYILANANGIQLTFDDCDKDAVPQPKTDAEAGQQEDVDKLAWRDEPVTTLTNYGLTEKQADKAQEAFGTLGRLQDWLCADYRDKQPGIGQALQDKLTDALNKYTDGFYIALKNRAAYNAEKEAEADAEAKTEEGK